MIFRLIILSGPLKGQRVTLEKTPLLVGRDADCSLRLEDESVGGRHAEVEPKGDSFYVRDLGTAGGTRVNDEAVEKAKLKHGDVIQIGGTRLFVESDRPPGFGGRHGFGMLNRILVVVALVVLPVGFLCLVAYLEDVYLGIPFPGKAPAVVAGTNAPARPAQPPAERKAPNPGKRGETPIAGRPTQGTPRVEDAKRPASTARAIRIASVSEGEPRDDDEVDEMRVVEIRLASAANGPALLPEDVRVDVSLFDQQVASGAVMPTSAKVTHGVLRPEGRWGPDQQRIMRVTYLAPRGSRKNRAGSAPAVRYYGYLVRVYYRGQLQGEEARPGGLISYSPGAGREGGAGGKRDASPRSPGGRAESAPL